MTLVLATAPGVRGGMGHWRWLSCTAAAAGAPALASWDVRQAGTGCWQGKPAGTPVPQELELEQQHEPHAVQRQLTACSALSMPRVMDAARVPPQPWAAPMDSLSFREGMPKGPLPSSG